MSKISKEVSTLDKLAWAGFTDRVKIAKAARILRSKGYGLWHLDDDKDAKRELRLLVHKTAPGKGNIMNREEEIKAEVGRQANLACRRKDARPDEDVQEKTEFRLANEYPLEGDDGYGRNFHKERLIRSLGSRLGIDSLKGFQRLGDSMLYFSGGWSGFREVFIRVTRTSTIFQVLMHDKGKNYDTVEELLAALPLGAIDAAPTQILYDIAMKGAKLSANYRLMETEIAYPSGLTARWDWNAHPVFRPSMNEDTGL